MSEERVVQCGSHGSRRAAFVCQHLVRGSGLGFFVPDVPEEDLQAWCSECEEVRLKFDGWHEESEKFARITLICDMCFECARERNTS